MKAIPFLVNGQDEERDRCQVMIRAIAVQVSVERFPADTSRPVAREELRMAGKDVTLSFFQQYG